MNYFSNDYFTTYFPFVLIPVLVLLLPAYLYCVFGKRKLSGPQLGGIMLLVALICDIIYGFTLPDNPFAGLIYLLIVPSQIVSAIFISIFYKFLSTL